ncbi:transcriptional regulator, ArsR family [Chthonomonas calidirosea]|uniref:ArsR/SmtB family transcription factor n=1 Tax=Chthonomonas calidirosea TaxID=454171 RepID=UPI0006DD48BB|nr:metalloregulator ArsR/SmtB family transcription factor [Chthonomonas calidirosea]CEK20640.1 transcriptional regulator, ArsR family [Chthonomonas calidirosea]CEK20656.1 transcriptional regulator, ArsR family [Chthonomonas calidirosea]
MTQTETKETLIDLETLQRVAPIIRNAAHPLRLRILDYLQHAGGERNVSQIVEAAEAEQAVVSQQLRILKDQGILSARREGTNVYYRIADPSVLLLLDCIRHHKK